MEVDLYQRHGLYGLGDDTPVTDQPIPAYLQQPATFSVENLSQIGTGLSQPVFGGMSLSTVGLLAIGAWVILSAIGRGTSRAYQTVAKPIKRRQKKKKALGEAKERYERERKRISEGSSRRSGGFF